MEGLATEGCQTLHTMAVKLATPVLVCYNQEDFLSSKKKNVL
jgi:hypothetical protein